MGSKINKIAILTLYGEFNFGNKLQNYALLYILNKYGFLVKTLQVYQSTLIPTYKDCFKVIIKAIFSIFPFGVKYKNQRLRKDKFKKFSKKYLNLTGKYNTKNVPDSLFQKFDAIVVGSDQVWNDCSFFMSDIAYFTLKNQRNIRKFSFSASIGKESFRSEYEKFFQEALSDFEFISCRESTGVTYLRKLVNKECTLIFDPTLFLSKAEWEKIMRKPSWLKKDRFALIYFLGKPNEQVIKSTNDKVTYINIMDMNEVSYNTSPEEFIYLISNASEVLTDSFHACVFSMIFGKTFTVFERLSNNKNNKMESRILSLFSIFRIEATFGEKITPMEYLEFNKIRENKAEEYEQIFLKALTKVTDHE